MIQDILTLILVSFIPIGELRASIPLGISMGHPILLVYIICVISNIMVIPLVYFFLNYLHKYFLKIKIYNKLFNHYLEKKRGKLEKYLGTKFEFIALMMFVAIPLPITGVYTGTLLAWFFKLSKKETYSALGLGAVIAGIIVTTLTILTINGYALLV